MSTAEQDMRPLTDDETADYLAGERVFPGAVETEHGVMVPAGAWVIGRNMAGYLPESDTYAFATWREAWDALAEEARRYADEDDDRVWEKIASAGPDAADEPTMRATIDAILSDRSYGPGSIDEDGPVSFWAEDEGGRTIVFWLQWEPTRAPGTDDFGYPLD